MEIEIAKKKREMEVRLRQLDFVKRIKLLEQDQANEKIGREQAFHKKEEQLKASYDKMKKKIDEVKEEIDELQNIKVN